MRPHGFNEMGRALISALIGVSLLAAVTTTSASQTPAGGAAAIAAAFSSWCLGGQPDFAAEDRRATAAGYQVFMDRTFGTSAENSLRQKNWLVPDPTGTFMLTSEQGSHEGTHIVGCGITADYVYGEAVAQALAALPQLGSPKQRVDPAPSGGVTVWWDVERRPATKRSNTQVMLAYRVPGIPGAMVNLIDRSPAKP